MNNNNKEQRFFIEYFFGEEPQADFATWGIEFPCDAQGHVSKKDLDAVDDLTWMCWVGRTSVVYSRDLTTGKRTPVAD